MLFLEVNSAIANSDYNQYDKEYNNGWNSAFIIVTILIAAFIPLFMEGD